MTIVCIKAPKFLRTFIKVFAKKQIKKTKDN